MNPIDPEVVLGHETEPADVARAARRFGFGVLLVFGLAGAWLALHKHHVWVGCLFGAAGVLIAVLALTRPRAALALRRSWMRVARAVGGFNTRVLLVIVYVAVVTPLGLLMRLFGRDPLERSRHAGTYWHEREQSDDPDRWKRPF